MQLVTPSQMKQTDRYCDEHTDLKESVLIQHAAEALAREIGKSYPRLKTKSFLFVCGKGNNGNDGKKAAEILKKSGADTHVWDITDKKAQIPDLESFDAIVDCILGTGFRGTLSDEIAEITKKINDAGKTVFAADIPTGVDALTGNADENAVKASVTVAFCNAKPGHALFPGRELCGKLKVWDIGIPSEIIDKFTDIKGFYYSNIHRKELLEAVFPKRPADSHKGDFGKVGIVAGSFGMCGAAALTAESALRTGAGLVYSFLPEELIPTMETILRENVKVKRENIFEYFGKLDVIAIGPGLGRSSKTQEYIKDILKKASENYNGKLVLDADGIMAFAGKKEELIEILKTNNLGERTVITPHTGEFAALTGKSIEEILSDRVTAAIDASNEFGCTVLLKGAATVTAYRDTYTINGSGNPGMATAGSGDVLTGIISAIAVRENTYNAGRYGAFYHGVKGDKAATFQGEYGMIAGDMLK